MENEDIDRPIAAPRRRIYPDLRKSEYENVSIDLINKNLNINSENIHIISNCTDKLPNNKVFVPVLSCEEASASSKSILTETNDLYGLDANENVATPIYSTPTPAPRPRKPKNNDDHLCTNEIYENIKFETGNTLRLPNIERCTGAISKESGSNQVIRKAPELPPKSYLSIARDRDDGRIERHSISSEVSTTISYNNINSYDLNDSCFSNTKTPKSASNDTLNSSIADSTQSSESSKFNSPSPGDILKSLGTTSKLLTESIGERVALRAKGAKHKLDKNLKTSTELLSNIGSETSSRLKNVTKRFGTNFTLGKKEKVNSKENSSTQYQSERPQTVPSDDKVFNTISFSSPLNRKAGGIRDLRSKESDCSYEVPRSIKIDRSDLDIVAPPSYEDALKSSPRSTFERNVPTSKSLITPKHVTVETEENQDAESRDSVELPSLPMPNFPPPLLPKDIADSDGIYGKLNQVQTPVRHKRRKNYESIQLRRVLESPLPIGELTLRGNVNSAELHQLNLEVAAAEREESIILRELNKEAEERILKPDRSESWEYYEDNEDNSGCSSPEPLYANQEATYGKVFEMATSNKDLLPHQNVLVSICEDGIEASSEGAVGGWVQLPKEIIKEFDPLLSLKCSTLSSSDKSNQLLLLEHLLQEDTYGTIEGDQSKSDDDISMCTSEEDNFNVVSESAAASMVPGPKNLTQTLPKSSSSKIQPQIVHQNAQLLSDSMENMVDVDEEKIKPYLSRIDDKRDITETVDLARTSHNRTNWFVQENKENGSDARVNPFNKLNMNEGECPPSYLEAIGADGRQVIAPHEQKSRASRFINTMNVFSNVKIRVDALKRKTSFRTALRASDVKVTLQMIPRPSLSPLLIRYEGQLIRFPSGVVEDILKEMQNRKAILRDRQFQTFLDQEMKTPKELIPLEYITTLQCVSNNRVTDNSTHFYCFEMTTSVPKNSSMNCSSSLQSLSNPNLVMTSGTSGNCKHQRVSNLYGVGKESERGVWMQKILESLTSTIPPKHICHYYRAGWCYLKNSITSEWSGTWLVLKKSQRRLIFVSEARMNVEKMDLRKARCIVLKDSDETIRNLHVESGPTLMIDCPPFTVYMTMSSPRETKIWRHIIREVAHNNGFSLSDQQLTKFNVPVIVDKCVNFVYIHGSMSEGIYRKSGSENSILKLMAAFRADAFNVEITRNEYNEHDVANVLKRFMRDLPERLMGKLSESFICVTELTKATDKIHAYKELLARLSVIERETLKKIVGHLVFISSQKTKNKMSVQNLTIIWGPTLLQSHVDEMVYSQKEADVLADLIVLYKNLFHLSADEMRREHEMLLCLQKYYAAAETLSDSVKKSGDLKMWITINSNPENTTEEKTQVNVTISPTKTAYQICKELSEKMRISTHQISLYEVILNGSLERPLHHDTKVFDVVLNWSYWPEDDRKNNILVVKPLDILREVDRAIKNLATVTPGKELKFADNRTKSLKSYQCELRDGKIVVSKKDKNDKTAIVREIFLQSTTVSVYLGCEKKRDFPWSWALTFVERTQTQILRSRDAPFIGHILAGSEWVDRTIWFSSIWYCLYGDSILPPAEIIIR